MANVQDVARCFIYLDSRIEDGDGISNLKLQKLVYYAQGFHLAIFGKPLFESELQAWTHGPVVVDLYHSYKQYGRDPIVLDDIEDFDPSTCLSDDQIELICEVHEVFGQYSAWTLRNMTHEEAPWLNNEENAGVISFAELEEYFKTRIQ